MDSSRECRTVEESNVNHTRSIWRPYDVPSSQDISPPSTGFVPSRSSASSSRVAGLYPQSPAVDFINRHDFIGPHLTPPVNIPPQLPIDNREIPTVGESTAYITPVTFRPYDVPLSQDISAPSPGFVSTSSSASLLRAAGYSQSPAMDIFTRPDFRGSHLTPGVNMPPWLPMDNRRQNQTLGESTANNSTAIFRPCNVPLTQDISAPSTSFVSSSSSAFLSGAAGYPQSPAMDIFTRPDFRGSHLTPCVNPGGGT